MHAGHLGAMGADQPISDFQQVTNNTDNNTPTDTYPGESMDIDASNEDNIMFCTSVILYQCLCEEL